MRIEAIGRLPVRQHSTDAGADLIAGHEATIPSGGRALVGTGLRIQLPPSTVGMVCPRSGLAARHGVTVGNSPGVVDESFRGEIKVLLVNHGRDTFRVKQGDRIAQLIIVPVFYPEFVEVAALDSTDRGEAGFGSTGRAAA